MNCPCFLENLLHFDSENDPMENLPAIIASVTFLGAILLAITEWIPLVLAALLGALILVITNVMTLPQAIEYIGKSHGTLGLFFGVMVLVRVLEPTKIFEYLGTQVVIWARGRGDRLLLGIVAITTPICALLPNATTVMLIAPMIPAMAMEIGVDFVPLLILLVFVANSAGLLTIVGDPATFIVGDGINLSFADYLQRLSFGGLLAIGTTIAVLPILFRRIWRTRLNTLANLPHPQIAHPEVLVLGGVIMAGVLTFFVVGEMLPVPVPPATVALFGAALALLLAHLTKLDRVERILRDLDWSTLIFFMSIFVLIGGLEKTGILDRLSDFLAMVLGRNITLGAIAIVFLTGIISSVVPNIPLVVAMMPLLKQYLLSVGMISPLMAQSDYTGQFPPTVLPLFYGMMFGATLGGNATLVGASSNIIAAGVAQQHDRSISFNQFLQYGIPVAGLQLLVVAIYILLRF
jgi:Na+/H+ antiporter NhaD/arsenite permease-like protein